MNRDFLISSIKGISIALLICMVVFPTCVSSSEILYEGPLTISEKTITIPSNLSDTSYDVQGNTPLGILASVPGLSLKVSDKIIDTKGILLLDGINSFEYDKSQGTTWICEVNGVILDDYGNPGADGFNKRIITADDSISFYYGTKPVTAETALASIIFTPLSSASEQVSGATPADSSSADSLEESEEPSTGSWSLTMTGAISDSINQSFFEESASCHKGSWKDENGNEYTGIPLWRLLGWVDDEVSHGSEGFNDDAFAAGYTVRVKAGDGYVKEFATGDIGTSNDIIIANQMNGKPLAQDGEKPQFPLKLVGPSIKGGNSVGNIVEIELTGLPAADKESTPATVESPETTESQNIRIVKVGTDGKTVVNETTVDYEWMAENLPVIGDGETRYKYEGITNNPEDVWDEEQTFPGGFKIDAAVKGTSLRDLVNLVGGMEPGTSLVLVASDGYETKLGYPTVYPNPDALTRAGEAFLAWYKDGKTVPEFKDGYQLFFTGGEDSIFSLWDMHETMDSNHWHYYWGDGGVQYASAAGLAVKYIHEIRVYTEPEAEWELLVDGTNIGGVKTSISSGYYDSAIVCQFGANHVGTTTDAEGNVWKGMPIWFLCGFVDDADQHSNNAYNETLADAGYAIVITGADGSSVTLESDVVKRSNDYIIASIRDDALIQKDDPAWPLVLTGAGVTEPVFGIQSIELKPLA